MGGDAHQPILFDKVLFEYSRAKSPANNPMPYRNE